jgi:UDP-N-acetylglucosamine 2-epimerase (non-hydrolysing)
MARLDEHCDHVLVHTGQNYDYELNEIFFDDLGIRRPDHFLGAAGSTAVETIGNVLIGMDRLLGETAPDAMLVLGDTNSCLAVYAAKRRKIPTFHMEAGNRCFDQRVPEEINRRVVDHLADINLCYSDIAREYLLAEGLPADRIIKTGSPMHEVLMHYLPKIRQSDVLTRLELEPGGFFVVSAHREENIEPDDSFAKLVGIINSIAETHDVPVIVSTHPRTRKRVEATGATFHSAVRLLKPLGFTDFVRLEMEAVATLSDSGTITEEASILNFPALNIRESHERPEGMEEAAVMMVGLNPQRVMQGLEILASQPRGKDRTIGPVADYSISNVSDKVVRLLVSYTDYVNRVVWRKHG